jgi:hypothetical protein
MHHKFSMIQAFVFYFLSSLIHIYIQKLPVSLMKIKESINIIVEEDEEKHINGHNHLMLTLNHPS